MFRGPKRPSKVTGEKQVQSSKGLWMGTRAGSPGHTKWWWWGGTDTHSTGHITSAGGHRDSRGRGWTSSHRGSWKGVGWGENGDAPELASGTPGVAPTVDGGKPVEKEAQGEGHRRTPLVPATLPLPPTHAQLREGHTHLCWARSCWSPAPRRLEVAWPQGGGLGIQGS